MRGTYKIDKWVVWASVPLFAINGFRGLLLIAGWLS